MKPSIYLVADATEAIVSIQENLARLDANVQVFTSGYRLLAMPPNDVRALAIIDASLPDMSGISLLREIVRRGWSLSAILLSEPGDVSVAVAAMKLGAADILEKPVDGQVLRMAVHASLAHPRLPGRRHGLLADSRFDQLNRDERDILSMLASGYKIKAIARQLELSVRTIHYRQSSILHKLGVENREQLLRLIDSAEPVTC